jgi:hypothetical protein
LLANSSVSADPTADLLTFSVTDPDPAVAQKLATTYAREFTLYRRRLDTSALAVGLADVDRRLANLDAVGQGDSPLARQLTSTMHHLEALQCSRRRGRAPSSSARQERVSCAAALEAERRPGAIAGLALGLALAFLRDTLDTRCVPRTSCVSAWRAGARAHPGHRFNRGQSSAGGTDRALGCGAEAFRILKTNLNIIRLQHHVSSILITSTSEGEGNRPPPRTWR